MSQLTFADVPGAECPTCWFWPCQCDDLWSQSVFNPYSPNFDSSCVLEIQVNSKWHVVDPATWRAWTGLRRIDGDDHHGPCYAYLAPIDNLGPPYSGARACKCKSCQMYVAVANR